MRNKKNWIIVGLIIIILIMTFIKLTKNTNKTVINTNLNTEQIKNDITPGLTTQNQNTLMSQEEIEEIEDYNGFTDDLSFDLPEN